MKKNKMEEQENKEQEVTPIVEETTKVIIPAEEVVQEQEVIDSGKRAVNSVEEVKLEFVTSEFVKQLQLAIKHYTSVYGQTRDSQAAEIAKSCGTILAKVLNRV